MALGSTSGPENDWSAEDLTGSVVGRFRIESRLGHGGMGEVYLAEDTTLHRRVALKRVPPRLRNSSVQARQFLAEAERASQLNHRSIASIYDILQTATETFIVMEYVEGQTLRMRLQQGPLAIPEFLRISVQCAEALKAAHAQSIIHCDIKPENIMLTGEGEVKVLDFGIARCLPRAGNAETLPTIEFSSDSISGTPAYMAPEILLEHPLDGRADLFSLGVVFYEMLTGKNPFVAPTMIATAEHVLHTEPPAPAKQNVRVTPELSRIVSRMMAKKPAARFASAADLADALRFCIAAAGPGKHRLRSRRTTVIAGALLAAIVALGLFLISFKPELLRQSGVVKAAHKELAILPFVTPDASNRAMSDGLSETLSAKLSHLSDRYPIAVVSPSEARMQGVTNIDEARKTLGATLVLTGTLRRSGDIVRVTYALIDAPSHRQLRADSITSEVSNPFAFEDRVVDSILDSLQIAMQPDERRALAVRGTTEPQAYDYYLQGVGYLQDYHKPENVDSAMTVFRHALERDPKYASAMAGVGRASWYKYDSSRDPEWARKAQEACEKAVKIDDSAPDAHVCLGTVYNGTGRYEQALVEFQKAVGLEPSSEDARLGVASAYESLDRLSEAEAAYRRGIELRPNYWGGYNKLGVFYFVHARYPEALQMFERVVALAPDNFRGYSNLGGIYLALDQYDRAIPLLERSVAIRPGSDSYSNLGTAYFYKRRFADAARIYGEAVKVDGKDYMPWANLAEADYWTTGKRPEALASYRNAIKLARAALAVNPRDTGVLTDIAMYEAMIGDRNAARSDLNRALLAPSANNSDVFFKAAVIYKQAGNSEQALTYLQKCVAAGFSPNRIRDNPVFDDLASEPRLQALTRK